MNFETEEAVGRAIPEMKDAVVESLREITPQAKATLKEIETFFATLNRIFTPKVAQNIIAKMEE